jgi:hypothetical protein
VVIPIAELEDHTRLKLMKERDGTRTMIGAFAEDLGGGHIARANIRGGGEI